MEVPTQSMQSVQSNVDLAKPTQVVHSNIVQQPLCANVTRGSSLVEDDEELAFQMTLFMLSEADKKAEIALVDEEYAFREQLGANENGKSLYVKYPHLDRIKGDDLFFPLSAVVDEKRLVDTNAGRAKQAPIVQPKQSFVVHSTAQATIPSNVKTVVEAAGMNIRRGDASMLYGQSNVVRNRVPYQHREEYSLF
jgi:hypothetical protein